MRIVCPDCGKVYDIPDERLPSKKTASFNCQKCSRLIKLDLVARVVLNVDTARSQQTATEASDKPEMADLKKKVLKTLKGLPPMPQVVSKVREVMTNPRAGFKEIARVIETDQAIAALLLKTANSAYYGMSGKVSTIHQAAVVLGYETLEETLTVVVSSGLLGKRLKGYGMDSGDLWRHSLLAAFGAKIIAGMKDPPLENEAFSAGLIHDAGKLVLDRFLLEKKAAFENISNDDQLAFLNAEKRILGFDHSQLAFKLCEKWNIPQAQSLAIRFHHDPSGSQDSRLAYILHIADLVAFVDKIGLDGAISQMEGDALDFLGLNSEELVTVINKTNESVDKIMQSV